MFNTRQITISVFLFLLLVSASPQTTVWSTLNVSLNVDNSTVNMVTQGKANNTFL